MRKISLKLWPPCLCLAGVGGTQMHTKWLQGTLMAWLLIEVCSALCSLCQLAQLQLTPTRLSRCRELHYARPTWIPGHSAAVPHRGRQQHEGSCMQQRLKLLKLLLP